LYNDRHGSVNVEIPKTKLKHRIYLCFAPMRKELNNSLWREDTYEMKIAYCTNTGFKIGIFSSKTSTSEE
jgi:hypothetical protein